MKPKRVIVNVISKIYKIVYEAAFPPKCLVCGNFMHAPLAACSSFAGKSQIENRAWRLAVQTQIEWWLADYLCSYCIQGLAAVESPLCNCCGLPFRSSQGEDHLCSDCLRAPKYFKMARAALVYNKISTEMIHCFKYKSKTQLAGPLGALLMRTFRRFWDGHRIDVIVPVPLHIKRLMKRGFNQAYLLIRSWQTMPDLRLLNPRDLQIERDVLVRTAPTVPQTALSRAQRGINIKNAFDIQSQDKIADQKVLLIDDVYTTGATVNECARMLLQNGAKGVDVLTLARAV